MTPNNKAYAFIGVISLMLVLAASIAGAAVPIAKITQISGQAFLQSGTEMSRVTRKGHVLYSGDLIQTKKGKVQITFNDGAIVRLTDFSNTRIQEREEESGWLFKTRKAMRRITCFAGKLWFKSGASKRNNYLQTPTAVMGVRGSDGDFGYDPARGRSYVQMYTGGVDIQGEALREDFRGIGPQAADQSPVYRLFGSAYQGHLNALRTGRVLDRATARVEILNVALQAAVIYTDSPNTTVSRIDGLLARPRVEAQIGAAQAQVVVEELKSGLANAERTAATARTERETQAQAEAQRDIERIVTAIIQAESIQKEAGQAAIAAAEEADAGNLENAQRAADRSRELSEQAAGIGQEIRQSLDQYLPPPDVQNPTGTVEPETAPTTQTTTAPALEVTTTTSTSTTTTTSLENISPAQ